MYFYQLKRVHLRVYNYIQVHLRYSTLDSDLGFRFCCCDVREWCTIWMLLVRREARNLLVALECHPELEVLANRRTHCGGNGTNLKVRLGFVRLE